MIRSGKVIATQGNTLKVCFSRLEACDSCNLCGSGRDDTTVFIKGRAEVGDRVEVDMPESQVLKVSLLAYALPLLGLLLGLWLGTLLFSGQEIAVLLMGLAALGLSLAGLKLLDGKLGLKSRWQPRLVSVTPAGPETPGMDAGSPAID